MALPKNLAISNWGLPIASWGKLAESQDFSQGRVTVDDFADRLVEEVHERSTEGGIPPPKFPEAFVRDMLPNIDRLSSLSMMFLSTRGMPSTNCSIGLDYFACSDRILQAAEIETERLVLREFTKQILRETRREFTETEYNRKLLAYCFRKKPLTLGGHGVSFSDLQEPEEIGIR